MAARPQSPLGLFDVDGLLDDEGLAIRDTVRRFVDDKVRPQVAGWYESGLDPRPRPGYGAGRTRSAGHAPGRPRLRVQVRFQYPCCGTRTTWSQCSPTRRLSEFTSR